MICEEQQASVFQGRRLSEFFADSVPLRPDRLPVTDERNNSASLDLSNSSVTRGVWPLGGVKGDRPCSRS
jgi:hypothetical protein